MLTLSHALQAAHDCQIVHRDLKPDNVLIAPDGTPKLTDFGLAKLLDEESAQTHSDAILGTAGYMAPEQLDGGPRTFSPAVDVYGLGAILYSALTGQPPFRREGAARHTERGPDRAAGRSVTAAAGAVAEPGSDLSQVPAEVPRPAL